MPKRHPGYVPGQIYHLVARGVRQQAIFRGEGDYRFFLGGLRGRLDAGGHELLAYCLLPNHVHLLLRNGPQPLSALMQGLLRSYAHHFNQAEGKVGHVFQGRHRSRLCATESYLGELLRYIHLNPVRAGLARQPEAYRWSSLPAYLGRPTWIPVSTGLGLAMFDSRPARLLEFLDQPPDLALWNELDGELEDGNGPPSLSLQALLQGAATVFELPPVEICSRKSRRPLWEARKALAYVACHMLGHDQSQVAILLGRSQGTISPWLRGADTHRCKAVLETARRMSQGV